MRLEHFRRVGSNHRYGIANDKTGLVDRRGQTAHTRIAVLPAIAPVTINHGGALRKQIHRARDKAERGQRDEIRIILRKGFVVLFHQRLPWRQL
ncbi:MAG: Uncharacterised protein [SAR116 cluster bacterium]|nr:MAG: Uncharacterised protein [SAR116 cluster bacterium]